MCVDYTHSLTETNSSQFINMKSSLLNSTKKLTYKLFLKIFQYFRQIHLTYIAHYVQLKLSHCGIMLSRRNEKLYIPVNVLASSLSILVPSLVETQVKCRGSTSRSPVREVKLPSAAAQLLIFPFPEREIGICTII